MKRSSARGVQRSPSASDVSRETLDRLDAFVALLTKWQRALNLVSPSTLATVRDRDFREAEQLAALVPLSTNVAIDIGSGAGFPGLILAILTGVHFILIERDRRKSAFLIEAIRTTEANALVVHDDVQTATIPAASLVTSRAVSTINTLLQLSETLLRPEGRLLLPKGPKVATELGAAAQEWCFNARLHMSKSARPGYIIELGSIVLAIS